MVLYLMCTAQGVLCCAALETFAAGVLLAEPVVCRHWPAGCSVPQRVYIILAGGVIIALLDAA